MRVRSALAIPLNGKTVFNVGVLAVLAWALMWLFASERFYVKQVVTSGNSQVPSEVLGQVSGLEGYSVFWINPRRVRAQILETLPPVKSVQLRYGFIDEDGLGAWARLVVQERGDEILWQVAGKRYWIDEDGTLQEMRGVASATGTEPANAAQAGTDVERAQVGPRIVIQDIRPNPPARVDLEALDGARQLLTLLPEIRAFEYAPSTGLRLRHARGWMVWLGTGGDMAKRVGVLRAMEIKFAGEDTVQPTLVDLRYPDSPYYRMPDGAGPMGVH
jgi:hypothetical protein